MIKLIGGAGMKKGSFVWMFLLIAIFLVNAAEAKSLMKGEVYSLPNGEETIEVISSSELEITQGGKTIVAEYEFKVDKLRVVANVMGTKMVQYYLLTNEGLQDEKTGNVYYSKAALAVAVLEEKNRKTEEELEKRTKGRFAFSDKTGLDKETKLMWTRVANLGGEMAWDDAFKFVEMVNEQKHAGYSDWRLPSKEELLTLVEYARRMGVTVSINDFFQNIGFKNVQAYVYWSSTSYTGNADRAWHVNMDGGSRKHYGKTLTSYVWPVRAGQ